MSKLSTLGLELRSNLVALGPIIPSMIFKIFFNTKNHKYIPVKFPPNLRDFCDGFFELTPKAATASSKFDQHVPKEIPAQGGELLTGSEPILWMKLGQAANLRGK